MAFITRTPFSVLVCTSLEFISSSSKFCYLLTNEPSGQFKQHQNAAEEPTSGCPSSSGGIHTVGWAVKNEHARTAAIVSLGSQQRSPLTHLIRTLVLMSRRSRHALHDDVMLVVSGVVSLLLLRTPSTSSDNLHTVFVEVNAKQYALNNACLNANDIMVPGSASQASVPAVMASMLPQIQCASPPEAAQPQPGRERPLHQCQDCTQSYGTSTGLSLHRMSIHPLPNDPFYWCQCESKRYRKNNHLRHVLYCTLPPLIHYKCKCNVITHDKNTHVEHVRMCAVDYTFRGWNEPQEDSK